MSMDKPKCRLCGTAHYAREGCDFGGSNTSREGRRVLKAEAARPDATRTASTEKSQPKTANPGKPAGKKGNAEKPAPGKRKTAPKKKARR